MNESMSKNMLYIAQIEAERRKAGAKSYGTQVANNDYSHLAIKPKPKKKAICRYCGNEFDEPITARRTVCDDCKKEQRRAAMKKWWEKRKASRCRDSEV